MDIHGQKKVAEAIYGNWSPYLPISPNLTPAYVPMDENDNWVLDENCESENVRFVRLKASPELALEKLHAAGLLAVGNTISYSESEGPKLKLIGFSSSSIKHFEGSSQQHTSTNHELLFEDLATPEE